MNGSFDQSFEDLLPNDETPETLIQENEIELQEKITQAISGIKGVTSADQENREARSVKANSADLGEKVIQTCSKMLNQLYPQLKSIYEKL